MPLRISVQVRDSGKRREEGSGYLMYVVLKGKSEKGADLFEVKD